MTSSTLRNAKLKLLDYAKTLSRIAHAPPVFFIIQSNVEEKLRMTHAHRPEHTMKTLELILFTVRLK